MEKIRAFVAVEIPAKIRIEISALFKTFARQDFSIKWVEQNNLHITMLFLGDVNLDFIKTAQNELSKLVNNQHPFSMSLHKIGAFPDQKQPRIIWIGVDNGANQLVNLQSNLQNTFMQIGFKPETRKFHPHLTIGRVKFRFTNPKVFETDYQSESFSVNSVVLFKSTLLPNGPIYEKLGEYHFS